jgi:hypothetical protein
MSSTYSNLKFELITTGEQSGAWGATTNTNLGTAIEQALVGMATLTSANFTANVGTLTLTNTNAAQNARALCLVISSGSLSAAGTLNVPAIEKPYIILNNESYAITVKVSGQNGVTVPAGKRTVVYNNGTDVGNQIDYLASLTLGQALPITSGGTGSTSTTFVNLATNVTGTLPIANGGTGSTSTTFVNLATNVTGTLPLANGGTGQTSAQSSMNSLAGAVTSGSYLRGNGTNVIMATIQAADVPTLNQNTSGTAAGLSATLAVASGGTGSTTAQTAINTLAGGVTSGSYLRGNGTNIALATIQAADVPTLNQNTTGTAAGLSTTLAVGSGGTGLTATPTNGQIDIGNGTGFTRTTLTAGSGVSITNTAGGISIAATGSGGSVTSVAGTGTVNGISLTGTVTTAGSLTLGGTLSGVSLTTQVSGTLPVANGGTGVTTSTGTGSVVLSTSPTLVTPILGTPTSGNLANCTFPTLNQNTTGTAAGLSSTLAIASGGTANTTAQGAMNTFAGAVTSGSYLRGNGTNVVMSGIQAGDVPTLNQNTTGTAAGLSSILAVASGGTGTASPALVAGTNVTITGTWPNQTINSTASGGGSGTVTSVSGTGTVNGLTLTGTVTTSGSLTLGGTLSGVSLTTQVSGTLPVANGGTGTTTSTGSGSVVLSTSPTFTTPILGTPTSGNLANCTFPTLNQNTTGTAGNVTGTVAVANGGTGSTTSAGALTNLGAYAASNPSGFTSNTGTVTSVGGTGTVSGLSLTGSVTSSGNLTLGGTLSVAASNFSSQSANTVLAGPNGTAGTPTFRSLVAADIPTLNQATTNSAGSIGNSGGWNVTPSGAKLYFNYNGTNVGSLDASGNFIVLGNVTAYGSP